MVLTRHAWGNQNEIRAYPLDDAATCVADDGSSLPEELICDLHIWWPHIYGTRAYISSISVSEYLLTATIVATGIGTEGGHFAAQESSSAIPALTPLAAISVPRPHSPSRHYPLVPLQAGVGGWMAFGNVDTAEYNQTWRFSNPQATLILPRVAVPYEGIPVTSLGKAGWSAALAGLIRLEAGSDLEIVEAYRWIEGEEKRCIVFRLAQDNLDSLYETYAGNCGRRPENNNCGRTPIRTVAGLVPDCTGDICLRFDDGYIIPTPDSNTPGIILDTPLEYTHLCRRVLPVIPIEPPYIPEIITPPVDPEILMRSSSSAIAIPRLSWFEAMALMDAEATEETQLLDITSDSYTNEGGFAAYTFTPDNTVSAEDYTKPFSDLILPSDGYYPERRLGMELTRMYYGNRYSLPENYKLVFYMTTVPNDDRGCFFVGEFNFVILTEFSFPEGNHRDFSKGGCGLSIEVACNEPDPPEYPSYFSYGIYTRTYGASPLRRWYPREVNTPARDPYECAAEEVPTESITPIVVTKYGPHLRVSVGRGNLLAYTDTDSGIMRTVQSPTGKRGIGFYAPCGAFGVTRVSAFLRPEEPLIPQDANISPVHFFDPDWIRTSGEGYANAFTHVSSLYPFDCTYGSMARVSADGTWNRYYAEMDTYTTPERSWAYARFTPCTSVLNEYWFTVALNCQEEYLPTGATAGLTFGHQEDGQFFYAGIDYANKTFVIGEHHRADMGGLRGGELDEIGWETTGPLPMAITNQDWHRLILHVREIILTSSSSLDPRVRLSGGPLYEVSLWLWPRMGSSSSLVTHLRTFNVPFSRPDMRVLLPGTPSFLDGAPGLFVRSCRAQFTDFGIDLTEWGEREPLASLNLPNYLENRYMSI